MADQEAEPTTETTEASEDSASSTSRGRLLFIAMVSVGLTVGAGTGAMLVGPMLAKKLGKAPVADSAVADSTAGDSITSNGTPAVHLIADLVLNPAESGGSRFLLVTIALDCGSASAVTTFVARDAELRDVVLTTLARKTVDELTDVNTRDRLKLELQTAIQERFGRKSVQRIHFPQFVVQ